MTIVKFTPPTPPTWMDYFTTNRAALEDELRQLVAELTRRLAEALDDGDLEAARVLWTENLVKHIDLVLRDGSG